MSDHTFGQRVFHELQRQGLSHEALRVWGILPEKLKMRLWSQDEVYVPVWLAVEIADQLRVDASMLYAGSKGVFSPILDEVLRAARDFNVAADRQGASYLARQVIWKSGTAANFRNASGFPITQGVAAWEVLFHSYQGEDGSTYTCALHADWIGSEPACPECGDAIAL